MTNRTLEQERQEMKLFKDGDLPAGWTVTTLSQIAKLTRGPFGSALKKEFFVPDGYKVYEQQNAIYDDAKRGNYFIDQDKFNELERFQVYPGDFLVSCAGTIGKIARLPTDSKPGVINQALLLVALDSEIFDPRLFLYLFRSSSFQRSMLRETRGTAMKNMASVKELKSLEVPLPPLSEQKRIADKLYVLLSQVDACRERLERVPTLMKRFRQSVLAAATSGKLTEDWRSENGVEIACWETVTVGDLLVGIEAGLNVLCDERPPTEGEHGLVKISAVTWGEFNENESKTLPHSYQVKESNRIKVGDLLISRANTLELVGACVLVKKTTLPVYLSDKVLRLVTKDNVKDWLFLFLRSSSGRRQIEELASGNQLSMRNLSQANLKSIELTLPTFAERTEIVKRVDALLSFADTVHSKVSKASDVAKALTPALLAKAFRGDLVSQEENDEPAHLHRQLIQKAAGEKATPAQA